MEESLTKMEMKYSYRRRQAFLDNLLSDDDSHNLAFQVISDHEPEQNESSITFSPRSDPLHHEFAGEPLTLPARMIDANNPKMKLMITYLDHQEDPSIPRTSTGKPSYGYIRNHKKTVKNEQARTRESEEYKAEARKAKKP
ncbi:hypothetical protein Tco_0257562 [Tanacetum coccineum]